MCWKIKQTHGWRTCRAEHLFHTQASLLVKAQDGTARHIWSEWVYISLSEHVSQGVYGKQRRCIWISMCFWMSRLFLVSPHFLLDNRKADVIVWNVCTITNQTEGWCMIRFLGLENTFLSFFRSNPELWLRQCVIVIYCDLVMCFILQILLVIWNHLRCVTVYRFFRKLALPYQSHMVTDIPFVSWLLKTCFLLGTVAARWIWDGSYC